MGASSSGSILGERLYEQLVEAAFWRLPEYLEANFHTQVPVARLGAIRAEHVIP